MPKNTCTELVPTSAVYLSSALFQHNLVLCCMGEQGTNPRPKTSNIKSVIGV